MKGEQKYSHGQRSGESGAALPTVLLIAFLLLTASVALLSGVAAGTRNGTDMLSETKAFYAAESGLQATINALRHRNPKVTYGQADANPSMNAYIVYNYPVDVPDRVVIGQAPGAYDPATGEAYVIAVEDPDNYGAALQFRTDDVQTRFTTYTGTGSAVISGSGSASSVTITPPSSPTLTVTLNASSLTPVVFSGGAPDGEKALASFSLSGSGVMPTGAEIGFQIVYSLSTPRVARKTIHGKITKAAGSAPIVTFTSQTFDLVGSTIELCGAGVSGPNCPDVTLLLNDATPKQLNGYITPVEPVRLRVTSTGFGPNGAKKVLEAIIRKNIPNNYASGAATTMIGPSACPAEYPSCLGFNFAPGNSDGIAYSGCTADGTSCVPSFGLTNPTNLNIVANARRPNGQPMTASPPPALLTDIPDWQQSVSAMETFVDEMRTWAQGSNGYFPSPNGDLNNPGDFASGTGITFCEGSCRVGGSGGGVLVVTGQLTNLGGFSFRGLIVVIGEEGWHRNGGGDGQIIGNIVIAPYNRRTYVPENHTSVFLPPRYHINGGGNSDVIFGDISAAFGGTSGVSELVEAIAER